MNFAQREDSAHLRGLLTEDRLRWMLKEKNYYAVYRVSPFISCFTGKSFGFEGHYELTQMNA